MAFFIVRIFLLVITSLLNEVLPKLNLPFLKGYSPNKTSKKMPSVHINVIPPSSKSALITTFQEATHWLGRKLSFSLHSKTTVRGGHKQCLSEAPSPRDAKHTLSPRWLVLVLHFPSPPTGKGGKVMPTLFSVHCVPDALSQVIGELFLLLFIETEMGSQEGTVHLQGHQARNRTGETCPPNYVQSQRFCSG